jgi:hypothetical protein
MESALSVLGASRVERENFTFFLFFMMDTDMMEALKVDGAVERNLRIMFLILCKEMVNRRLLL